MGACNNRNETKSERIGRFANETFRSRDTSDFDWQTSKGAEIRGTLGVKKGNEFIEDINNLKR